MENNNQKRIPDDVKTQKKIGIVKTYAEDMVKVIEKNEGSIIKKIIHEQEEHEAIKKNISPESRRNKLFMLIGAVLILSAFIILIFLVILRNQISTVDVKMQFTPIIFVDKTEYKEIIGLNKDKIVQIILNEIDATNVKSGGVEAIYLTENQKIIGFRRFLKLIKANLTLEQITFVNDNFLIGIANNEGEKSTSLADNNLFILLKTRSFFDSFPVFKEWEKKMFYDLHSFFGVGINSDTSYLLTKDFDDGIVNNKNARILYDKEGKIVLEYVFADENYVIITNSNEAVQEVMLRFASGQIKK